MKEKRGSASPAIQHMEVRCRSRLELGLHLRLFPIDSSADDAAAVCPLDAAGHADVVVPDKAPNGIDPTLVTRQMLVKFLGGVVDGREPRPWHCGEIMMFIVKTDVVGEPV